MKLEIWQTMPDRAGIVDPDDARKSAGSHPPLCLKDPCSKILAGCLFGLVDLGARRLAGQEFLGLLDPFLASGAAVQRQVLVDLGDIGLGPGGDRVPAVDAGG